TNFRLQYRTSVNEPSIDQLQPIINITDPSERYTGNPELKPEYRHSLNARYFFFDRFNFRNLFVNAGYTYSTNNIVNSVVYDNFVKITTPENVKDNHRINGSLNFSTPVRPLYIKTTAR